MIAVPKSIQATAYATLPLDACDISLLNKNSWASNYDIDITISYRDVGTTSYDVPRQDQCTRGCPHLANP